MDMLLQKHREGEAATGIHAGPVCRVDGVRERGLVDVQGCHPQRQKAQEGTPSGERQSSYTIVVRNVDSGARLKSRDQKRVLLSKLGDLTFFMNKKGR